MSNSYIELLVTLGLATQESSRNLKRQMENLEKSNLPNLNVILGLDRDASVKNLKKHISSIQTNLPQLDVSLNVKSNPVDNKMFAEMEKQISSLQGKIRELEGKLKGFGGGGVKPSQSPFSPTEDGANRALKSVAELNTEIAKSNGRIKVVDDSTTGKVKEVVTVIKNELGQLEKRVYRPTVDIKMGDSGLGVKGLKEATKVLDSSIFDNFNKKANEAKLKLDEFARQGKLSEKSLSSLKSQLNNAFTTEDLDKLLSKMKQMGQIESHSSKWTNATNNIRNQSKEAIVELERLKQSASLSGLNTKEFDVLINKMRSMSNIKITNDSQIIRTNEAFSNLSSKMSALKNNTASFETAFKSFNNVLLSAERSGLMTANSIDAVRNSVNFLNRADLTLDVKVRRLKEEVSQLNAKLSDAKHTNKMMESMAKAKNEADKLAAALTRVENAYKRTVDKTAVASVRQEIERLSDVPLFTNTNQVRAYNQELRGIETRIRQINSDATTGSRDSLGVINAFRIAMERFPINYQVGIKLFELLETP